MRRKKVPPEETRKWKPILFRRKGNMIVPYITLFDNAMRPFPIKSIIVGPHPSQERQMEAVKMALEAEYLNGVEVRASGIPYRE